jgi:hypothetical protein
VHEAREAARFLIDRGKTDLTALGAGSYAFMELVGRFAIGWIWLRMAVVAERRRNEPFYAAKLITARYYAERWLPECATLTRQIEAGPEAMMALAADAFVRS